MKKATIIATLLVLASVAAPAAQADRSSGPHDRGPGYRDGMMDEMQGLDLTAEQTRKIKELREAHLKEIKPLQEQLLGKGGELRRLWLARTPDEEKILALQREVRALREQLMEKMTVFRQEASQLLTPEQLTKVRLHPGMGRGMTGGAGGMGVKRMEGR